MNPYVLYIVIGLFVMGCGKEDDPPEIQAKTGIISAVDISSLPEIRNANPVFYDRDGNTGDFLTILRSSGVNTIRLRLWVHPETAHSGFEEVKAFSNELKSKGFKTWLSLHYSDTWADPGKQETPALWQQADFNGLKDSVENYTKRVMEQMQPDYIQVGNEINPGFLHPKGEITANKTQFLGLMETAIDAVRNYSPQTKIIIHFAGIQGATWFFNTISSLDYDIIGLSYYPIWHGKDLNQLKNTMIQLSNTHQKQILIAETAYPFTLGWNDWTNNIVGLDEQLILPEYPATLEGQRAFVGKITDIIVNEVEGGIGFCYWGAELIAWKGSQATDASPWENQALFNFGNRALPALEVFGMD